MLDEIFTATIRYSVLILGALVIYFQVLHIKTLETSHDLLSRCRSGFPTNFLNELIKLIKLTVPRL